MRTSLRKYFFFLFLLPVFFVLHGFNEHYDFIPVRDALFLTLIYLFSSLLLLLIFWLWYRNFIKASLAAFSAMGIHLFFGSFHDLLKNIFPGSLLSKYSFILTLLFLLFFTFLFVLKKKKKNPEKTCLYLNLLFIVLIIAELGFLGSKIISGRAYTPQLPEGFIFCNNCPRPDIYFILADEYAGNTELKDMFGFDNNDFTNELTKRGFHVIQESYSNYNYTPYAIGSILNMDYIPTIKNKPGEQNLTASYKSIRENRLLKFLLSHQYQFYNYSVFDFEGYPSSINKGLLPVNTKLISSQTLISRLNRDLRFNLITRLQSKKELKKWTYSTKENNELIYNLTWKLPEKKTTQPKFVYTHLEMPHYPYYFNKEGKEQPFETLLEGNQVNKNNYIEYLQHTNKELLKLVNNILATSVTPPVIILMGDHGFRHFTQPIDDRYHYLNLSALFLPDKNYLPYKDSLSGINFFRIFLNNQFRQKLNYVKDTTIFIKF